MGFPGTPHGSSQAIREPNQIRKRLRARPVQHRLHFSRYGAQIGKTSPKPPALIRYNPPGMHSQTPRDTPRGVQSVELEEGYALVEVRGLAPWEISAKRREALQAIESAGISLDLFKITMDGFSFVVAEPLTDKTQEVLRQAGFQPTVLRDQAILLINTPNVRDADGLLARICSEVISADAEIQHLGDMHTGVMIVLKREEAERARERLENLARGDTE
jgi:aspartokinase